MLITSRLVRPIVLLLAVCGLATGTSAQGTVPADLGQTTLEDLMKIKITSASRREQRADEVPAAVYVITQDDIRRSGLRTLPELLRLAPGVQVAQINSSNWAVSIRGFNDQFSNKLLVLIDGRSIYKRTFSGVFWDAEDMVLDDIDHIEVIRGPGGSAWGANAVNGVINIVTKTAAATAGGLVRVSGGSFDRMQATAQYGGSLGPAAYRVYSQWSDREATQLADGTPAHDDWTTLTTGARVDWTRGHDDWTLDGKISSGEGHPLWNFISGPTPGLAPETDRPSTDNNGSILGRWTHHAQNGSSLQLQSVLAISRRLDNVIEHENTFDTQLQYHTLVGARHDVVVGSGYRLVDNNTSASFSFSITPPGGRTAVLNVFGQDEIALSSRLRLTVGSKIEHDTVAAWGVEPTVRLMWEPARRQHVWLASSRALRTPSNKDLIARINVAVVPGADLPIVIALLGNPTYQPEVFQDLEAGYRVELGTRASIDVTTFRGRYAGLPTNEPLPPVFESTPAPAHLLVATQLQNLLQADTAGVEVAARLDPVPWWHLNGSYSGFHLTPHLDPASHDATAAFYDGNAPAHQWQLGSTVALGVRAEVNATVFRSGPLLAIGVPAYTRADGRVECRLSARVSLVAAGRNLFDSAHPEYTSFALVATRVPRSADVQLIWKF